LVLKTEYQTENAELVLFVRIKKDRAEVRRERKSEITSAPLNAKLRSIKELRKIYYFYPRMFVSATTTIWNFTTLLEY